MPSTFPTHTYGLPDVTKLGKEALNCSHEKNKEIQQSKRANRAQSQVAKNLVTVLRLLGSTLAAFQELLVCINTKGR